MRPNAITRGIRMTAARETSRAEARRRRALVRTAASEKANRVCACVVNVLGRARLILADKEFRALLREQGIQTLPSCLSRNSEMRRIADATLKSERERLDEISLEFVVVWKCFFPLLREPAIEIRLERTWPGFILQLKDTFIALVTEGPFPHAISGHVGNRRGPKVPERGRRRGVVHPSHPKNF